MQRSCIALRAGRVPQHGVDTRNDVCLWCACRVPFVEGLPAEDGIPHVGPQFLHIIVIRVVGLWPFRRRSIWSPAQRTAGSARQHRYQESRWQLACSIPSWEICLSMYACRVSSRQERRREKKAHDPAAVEFNEGHKFSTRDSLSAVTIAQTCDRSPPLEGTETKALAVLLLDSTRAAIPTAATDGLRTLPIAHVCCVRLSSFRRPNSVGQRNA